VLPSWLKGSDPNCTITVFWGQPGALATVSKQARIPIYRVTLVREGKMPTYESRIRSSASAYTVLQEYLDGVDREHFVVMLLDQKNSAIGLHTVSIGSLTASIVAPREVFKVAILANCANILLAHNHPSGAPRSA